MLSSDLHVGLECPSRRPSGHLGCSHRGVLGHPFPCRPPPTAHQGVWAAGEKSRRNYQVRRTHAPSLSALSRGLRQHRKQEVRPQLTVSHSGNWYVRSTLPSAAVRPPRFSSTVGASKARGFRQWQAWKGTLLGLFSTTHWASLTLDALMDASKARVLCQ